MTIQKHRLELLQASVKEHAPMVLAFNQRDLELNRRAESMINERRHMRTERSGELKVQEAIDQFKQER